MMYVKTFASFAPGLTELANVYFSAKDALTMGTPRKPLPETEEEATTRLALNVIWDRPTGNGVDWDMCSISISAYGVTYTTRGGITFGWRVYPEGSQEYPFLGYRFFVTHAHIDSPDSSLAASAQAAG